MSAPIIAFFNNKGGVGKTSLVYHLSWMFADLGLRVLGVDLDPQANLTSAFFDDDALETLWPESGAVRSSVFGAIEPLIRGVGDVSESAPVEDVGHNVRLLPGDLALSQFETQLAQEWPHCLDGQERAFRVTTAFWRVMRGAASTARAGVILVDLGPNLGALNRAALVACDHLVVPLAPDLFSLQGLRNLGPTVRRWRQEWSDRRARLGSAMELPEGKISAAGYVVMQHAVRADRPVKSYEKWVRRIPLEYGRSILQVDVPPEIDFDRDSNCIGLLKHYRSLMPMAQEARKPIFHLKAADGALGGHQAAVDQARRDFRAVAEGVAARCGVSVPA